MSSSVFPIMPSGSLTKGEIIDYLKDFHKRGYLVYVDQNNENLFTIKLTTVMEIKIHINESENNARLELSNGSRTSQLGTAKNLDAFINIVTNQGRSFGVNFGDTPKNSLLVKGEPLSNLAKIVSFGSPKLITEIHDPYIDETALNNITILYRLGLKFSGNLRIVTTTSKPKQKLSESCWDHFKTEIKVQQAEIRRLSDFHRRFLLGGGKSIRLGLSLNQIDYDETIDLVKDDLDRAFFESQWAAATILYAKKT